MKVCTTCQNNVQGHLAVCFRCGNSSFLNQNSSQSSSSNSNSSNSGGVARRGGDPHPSGYRRSPARGGRRRHRGGVHHHHHQHQHQHHQQQQHHPVFRAPPANPFAVNQVVRGVAAVGNNSFIQPVPPMYASSAMNTVLPVSPPPRAQEMEVAPEAEATLEDLVLDYVEEQQPGLLSCALCLDPLVEPRRLPCDHDFCRACLEESNVTTCPVCRSAFSETGQVDRTLSKLLAALVVRCPREGCEWTGPRENVLEHMERSCSRAESAQEELLRMRAYFAQRQRLTISVGGVVFAPLVADLLSRGVSVFTQRLAASMAAREPLNDEPMEFPERDFQAFPLIVHYLQRGSLPEHLPQETQQHVADEASHYGINLVYQGENIGFIERWVYLH